MADFSEAFNIVMEHEGGYSNDKIDAGGETYRGISRVYHPSWGGWHTVDAAKSKPDFPDSLKNNNFLNDYVRSFYRSYYWDIILLDRFESQLLANEMFDIGVNMGTSRAVKFLQKALNYLNKNGTVYDDIVEDGDMGSNTLSAMRESIAYRGDEYIYKIMNILQGNHYLEYMKKSPIQEKYAFGWLKRVSFIKE